MQAIMRIFSLWALLLAACNDGSGTTTAPAPTRQTLAWKHFSPERAMEDVRALVALGPRPAASEGIEQSRRYIEQALATAGWEVQRQSFTAETRVRGQLTYVNLRARFTTATPPAWEHPRPILLGSHYDTKYFQNANFVGANDGASSTALLLEAARALAKSPATATQVELVFFDGEEAVASFTQPTGPNDVNYDGLYGSRYYANQLLSLPKSQRPRYLLLFDMIGDGMLEVEFPIESADRLVAHAHAEAAALGWERHFRDSSESMVDDHIPLLWAGLEVINFIDFKSYSPYWHTSADTLDKVNPQSIKMAGQIGLLVVEKYLVD